MNLNLMPSATPAVTLRASALLAALLTAAHAGALVCLNSSTLPAIVAAPLNALIVISAAVTLAAQALRMTPWAITAISLDGTGGCRLWRRDRRCLEGLQLCGGANLGLLLCLDLKDSRGCHRHLTIARDALAHDSLRALRLRFELGLAQVQAGQA